MSLSLQEDTIQRTPLYSSHIRLGASMVHFSGWEMPVQYKGILAEHEAVRKSVGIFDISHMGTMDVHGLNALELVQHVITNDASRLSDGKALYSPVCLPSGGVVDDVLVYRLEEKRYRFVVNAGNREKDLQWIQTQARDFHVDIAPMSDQIALVAVQGPNSRPLLEELLRVRLESLATYCFFFVDYEGNPLMVSRTGYTGELGYELFVPVEGVVALWDALLARGKRFGVMPVGLGARDTLRMEMGYCLYGHEIGETITPLEAGLSWTVAFGKPDFIGKEALLAQRHQGVARKLVGFTMLDRAIPRAGCEVMEGEKKAGVLTSGGFSPSLQCGMGLGLVGKEIAKEGQELQIRIRDAYHPAKTARTPLYNKK